MNTPVNPEQNDPLETLLRGQTMRVEDDGFTARVMASLPHRRHEWLRQAVLLTVSVIGFVLAGRWMPWDALKTPDLYTMIFQDPQQLTSWLVVFTVIASLIWAVVNAVSDEGGLT